MSVPIYSASTSPPRTDVHVGQYQPCCSFVRRHGNLTACAVHTHPHHLVRDRVISCWSFISHLMDSGLAQSRRSHPLLVYLVISVRDRIPQLLTHDSTTAIPMHAHGIIITQPKEVDTLRRAKCPAYLCTIAWNGHCISISAMPEDSR